MRRWLAWTLDCRRLECTWESRWWSTSRRSWKPFDESRLLNNSAASASINLALFREYDITKRRVQKIIKAGATVVLTTGGIDDFTLKEFVESGVMAVRRVKKEDLKRIAKATGGIVCISLVYL